MDSIAFFFLNLVIDLVFVLDMVITFRTCYIDDFGREVIKPIDIAKNYLAGEFWIDLFATLPLDVIIISFLEKNDKRDNTLLELFGILKLGRILRLNKIIQFLNVDEDTKASMKLTKMIFFLVIYIHLFACTWWLLVKWDETWIPYADESDFKKVYTSSISY